MNTIIGSVPYLNEKPLTRWFHHTLEGRSSNIDVVYAPPSELALMLRAGDIDAALVSSFEYFKTPGYTIVPGVSISTQYDVMSVRAFSPIPWKQIESIALDTSSLTSAALMKILLAEQYQSYPTYIHHRPNLQEMLAIADSALLIGDNGMLADGTGLRTLDLGQAWRQLTNLPFVYAVWLAKDVQTADELKAPLRLAKAWGLTQIDEIASDEARRLSCPIDLCLHYLTQIMDYDLNESHFEALDLFGAKAKSLGLLSETPPELVKHTSQSAI